VQVVQHEHLEVVVAHGEIAIFGHDEVEAYDVGIGGGYFEAKEGLREDLLRWVAAEDLVQPVDADVAGGGLAGAGVAVLEGVARGLGIGELFHIGGDFIAQAGGEELIAELGQLFARDSLVGSGRPAEFIAQCGGVGERRGLHDLDVLLVLRGGAGDDFVEPLPGVVRQRSEAVEGGEKLVVAVDAFGRDEGAHGEAVDEVVVERLVVES